MKLQVTTRLLISLKYLNIYVLLAFCEIKHLKSVLFHVKELYLFRVATVCD